MRLKIKKLKNAEKGKRVFILGNGPSILKHDLSKLKNEICIGMNASTLLEEKYGFTQKYYTVSDARFLNHPEKRAMATTMLSPDTIRVLRSDLDLNDDSAIVANKNTYYVNPLSRDGFSYNLNNGYHYGCTTTMLALQLAHYLGASEIVILGVDLNYYGETARFYSESNAQLEDSKIGVQIFNIADAANKLAACSIRTFICNQSSFLAPYLRCEDFDGLFCS
ncbi:6-hydroxymethylpterin diphosphokinase MptE-like protein [Deefgea piscis]|nr:6-hydroxymethylpterin diphosphokinase MptE-like protein [Deefgea piscis]